VSLITVTVIGTNVDVTAAVDICELMYTVIIIVALTIVNEVILDVARNAMDLVTPFTCARRHLLSGKIRHLTTFRYH